MVPVVSECPSSIKVPNYVSEMFELCVKLKQHLKCSPQFQSLYEINMMLVH
jgi:hypothetical protein